MNDFWDARYKRKEYVYGRSPNAFLKETLPGLSPGKILMPGEGEGRNAVYAAKLGWEVHAFDQSRVAMQKAQDLAKENNVKIGYTIAHISDCELPENAYDAVNMVFLHLPPGAREIWHKQLYKSLRPGGILIMEAFDKEQITFRTGGPSRIEMLYSREILESDFSDFRTLHITRQIVEPNEGADHSGHASTLRVLGEK